MNLHKPKTLIQRFWKPAAVTGAGSTALAVWFEEILLFAADILALIFLPLLAGLIYLFNLMAFNARDPRREVPLSKQIGDQQ